MVGRLRKVSAKNVLGKVNESGLPDKTGRDIYALRGNQGGNGMAGAKLAKESPKLFDSDILFREAARR